MRLFEMLIRSATESLAAAPAPSLHPGNNHLDPQPLSFMDLVGKSSA